MLTLGATPLVDAYATDEQKRRYVHWFLTEVVPIRDKLLNLRLKIS
jgi:hypothetical protein